MNPVDLAIPILPSQSLTETLTFYERLGFDGELRGDAYAIVRRGMVEIHFFAHPDLRPDESSAMCYIRVADVESLSRAFAMAGLPQSGLPRQDPLAVKPWGMREFAVVDRDGNLIRIGQAL